MTLKVRKSEIHDADFAALVETHRQNLTDHQMGGLPGVPPVAPHPLIEDAVKRVRQPGGKPDLFVADFEIIDDTPPPLTQEERKIEAINESRRQEQAQIEALLPPIGLRRLRDMEFQKAMRSVHEAKGKGEEPSEAAQKIIDDRAALDDQIAQVQYAGALREAEIEAGE